jgi:hypothetical protein
MDKEYHELLKVYESIKIDISNEVAHYNLLFGLKLREGHEDNRQSEQDTPKAVPVGCRDDLHNPKEQEN